MNINNFVSNMNRANGLARPTKYGVYINPNAIIMSAAGGLFASLMGTTWFQQYADVNTAGGVPGSTMGERLRFFCARAALPGYQFETDRQKIYGPAWVFPHTPQYEELPMTFYVGADMQEKYFFDAWMYQVMDPITNDFNYIAEYATDIDIVQYDDTDSETYVTTLVDAYPISIGSMQLAWDAVNEIHKLDVTFAYKFAIPFAGKDSTSGTQVRGTRQKFFDTIDTGAGSKGGPNKPKQDGNSE